MLSLSRRGLTLVALTGLVAAQSADAIRVMTYNVLNYSSGRTTEFREVLAAIQPDVLVLQEVLSQPAVDTFHVLVLENVNPGEWTAGEFDNGPDTDNAIFYRTALIDEIDHYLISTSLRDIDEWTIRPDGYTSEAAKLRVYSVHLKASQGFETQRLGEVQAMRARMETYPPGQSYLVLGDFNIYTSNEPAYIYMLGTTGGFAGVVEDPIDMPGDWHNDASFASIHTQSPRTSDFGGGSTGGMDDRFDMILTSPSLQPDVEEGWSFITGTYEAFGNDGFHFNDAIIDPPAHPTLPASVIQALHDASDHLPVIVELSVPSKMVVGPASIDFGPWITGSTASTDLTVENPAIPPADVLQFDFSISGAFSAPAGEWEAEPGEGPVTHPITMITDTPGFMTGDLFVSGDAPDNPAILVPVSGVVIEPADPSTSSDVLATTAPLDFGTHATGEFTDQTATIYSYGHYVFQSDTDIYAAELTGDPRFSIVGGFTPSFAGFAPATYDVAFDDTGAPDGTYLATLTFSTRDNPVAGGAQNRADIVFELSATVDGGTLASGDPAGPVPAGFVGIAPNPFWPSTRIAFGVGEPGRVDLDIYDVSGRALRRVVSRAFASGVHTVSWDGRDDAGRRLGSGIYFARLRTPESSETRVVIRAR